MHRPLLDDDALACIVLMSAGEPAGIHPIDGCVPGWVVDEQGFIPPHRGFAQDAKLDHEIEHRQREQQQRDDRDGTPHPQPPGDFPAHERF